MLREATYRFVMAQVRAVKTRKKLKASARPGIPDDSAMATKLDDVLLLSGLSARHASLGAQLSRGSRQSSRCTLKETKIPLRL